VFLVELRFQSLHQHASGESTALIRRGPSARASLGVNHHHPEFHLGDRRSDLYAQYIASLREGLVVSLIGKEEIVRLGVQAIAVPHGQQGFAYGEGQVLTVVAVVVDDEVPVVLVEYLLQRGATLDLLQRDHIGIQLRDDTDQLVAPVALVDHAVVEVLDVVGGDPNLLFGDRRRQGQNQ